MVHVPDELIMAYADGQVSAEEKAWLDGILAVDPNVRARLEPFLATGHGQLPVFDALLSAPVPDRLIDTVRGIKPAPQAAKPAAKATTSGRGLIERLFPNGFGLTPALGYAATLLVGVGLGSVLLTSEPADQPLLRADRDGFVASGRLQVALDTIASGDRTQVREGDVRPVVTVRGADGRICRQYEIVSRNKGPQGLACRESDGGWRITVLTGGETGATARNASQGDNPVLEGMVGQALKSLPGHSELSAAEELYLIEKGWGGAPAMENSDQK